MNWFRYLPPLTALFVSVALTKVGLLPLPGHVLFLGVALVLPTLAIARFNGVAGAAISGLWSVGLWWLRPGSAADALVFGIVAVVLLVTWILHLEKGARTWDSLFFAVGFQALTTADHWASGPTGKEILGDLGPAVVLAVSLVWIGHRLGVSTKVSAYALLAMLLPLPGASWPLAGVAVAALASTWILGRLKEPRNRWTLSLILLVGALGLADPGGSEVMTTLKTSLLMAPFLYLGRNRAFVDGVAAAFLGIAMAVALPSALALPVILGFLLLREPVGSLAVPERAWLAILGLGSLVLGSYPWGRPLPLNDTVSLLGMEPTWLLALGCFLVLVLASVGTDLRSPVGAVVVGLWAIVLLVNVSPRGGEEYVKGTSLTLTANHQEVEFILEGARGKEIVLDSALANAADLEKGVAVAEVTIEGEDGGEAVFVLMNGRDTGEWAHREPVVAGHQEPWIYWNPEGVSFLGRRFRLRRDLGEKPIRKIRVRRHSNLPPEVEVSIFHLEIRE